MNIDNTIHQFQNAQSLGKRIEPLTPECLSLSSIQQLSNDTATNAHTQFCLRCQSLLNRFNLVKLDADDFDYCDFEMQLDHNLHIKTLRRNPWIVLSPLASAACLIIAVGYVSWQQSNNDHNVLSNIELRENLSTLKPEIDSAIQLLYEKNRSSTNDKASVDKLNQRVKLLEDQLDKLVKSFEQLVMLPKPSNPVSK